MKNTTRKVVKEAKQEIQEAMDLLETIDGENDEIDNVCENLGFAIADIDYELNS